MAEISGHSLTIRDTSPTQRRATCECGWSVGGYLSDEFCRSEHRQHLSAITEAVTVLRAENKALREALAEAQRLIEFYVWTGDVDPEGKKAIDSAAMDWLETDYSEDSDNG